MGLPLKNGDFLIGGETEDIPGSGIANIFLIRTDSLGNEKWRKIYNYGGYQYVNALYEFEDGRIIISGGEERESLFIITDSIGNVINKKSPVNSSNVNAAFGAGPFAGLSLNNTNDSFYGAGVVTNYLDNNGFNPKYMGLIFKTDLDGNLNWFTKVGPYSAASTQLWDAIATQDGGAVAGGSVVDTNSQFGTTQMAWLVKTDGSGNVLWQRYFGILEGEFSDHWIMDILELPDGSIAGCGWVFPSAPDTGQQDAWIFKTDSYGCIIPGCNATDGIENQNAQSIQLQVYPNPATEYVAILQQGQEGTRFTAEIYNLQGQKIKYFSNLLCNVTYTWELSNMARGVYVIKTLDEKGKTGNVKIVKE